MQQLFTRVKRRRGHTVNVQVSSDVSNAINHFLDGPNVPCVDRLLTALISWGSVQGSAEKLLVRELPSPIILLQEVLIVPSVDLRSWQRSWPVVEPVLNTHDVSHATKLCYTVPFDPLGDQSSVRTILTISSVHFIHASWKSIDHSPRVIICEVLVKSD